MAVLNAFESIRIDFLTAIMRFFSLFGEETFLIIFLSVIYWCFNKRLAYKIVFTIAAAGSTIGLLKNIFCVSRPWIVQEDFSPAEGLKDTALGYAFPSFHAGTAAGYSINIIRNIKKKIIKFIFWVIMIMVAVSRLYLGAQTIISVIVSIAITFVIAIIVNALMDDTSWDRSHYRYIVGLIAILPFIAVIFNLSKYYSGLVEYSYIQTGMKISGVGIGAAISWYVETVYIKFHENTDKVWKQFLKAAAGLIFVFAVKYAFRALFLLAGPESWLGDFVCSLLSTIAGMAVYPVFIKKYFSAAY